MATGDSTTSPVIDFGAHLHPSEPSSSFAYVDEHEGPIYRDIDLARERFEAGGLDGAVFSQSRHMGDDNLEENRAANDELLEVVGGHDHYYALAALPTPLGGETAAEELERCLENGYNGGALETESDGNELTDEELEPVFEVADRTGAPLLIHPKIHDSLGPDVFDDSFKLNATFGREVAICEQVTKAIHSGLLDRYENLNFVAHHTAGNIASMMARLESQLRDDRDPPAALKSPAEFREQLASRIYMDLSGHDGSPTVYRNALDVFEEDKLMLGSDFPYETRTGTDFENLIDGVREAAPDMADRILGQNALDLLVNTN